MDNLRSHKRLSEGEPSRSAKRPMVDGNVASSHDRLERVRSSNFLYNHPSPETTPAPSQVQELYEVQQIIANLAEVPLIDNTNGEARLREFLVPSIGLGPAGRDHLRFTDITREASDQAGPSDHLRQLDQLEQKLPQRAEAPHQVSQTDIIRLMKQIEDAPLTWERRREKLKCLIQSYQSPEQGQAILPQRHEGQDQAGPSHHGNAQRESISEQKRTWTTEELHQLVDEMVQIKNFNHKNFQKDLSEESQAILEQLNMYGKSLNGQEWEDMQIRLKKHNLMNKDKRYRYLFARYETTRNLQKQRELAADVKAKQQGFKNRHERLSRKKQRLNDASKL